MPIAQLSIDIVAQLASLESGLDKAYRLNEKTAAQIDARWSRMQASAVKLGQAIGSAFAVHEIVAFTRETIDAIDALNDAADATGATVENLSALEDVARRNGGTLDDVTSILVKFNGALKEADGKNTISQAIKAIGLDAAQLRKEDPAEALRKVAVALSGYADDGNKARLVQELFGKSIREAAPYLHDLAEAGKLNATRTGEQARQAEIFNKQLAALQTEAGNAARSLVSEFLPTLNTLTERFKKSVDEGTPLKDLLLWIGTHGFLTPILPTIDLPPSSELDRLQNILVGLQNVQAREPDNAANNRRLALVQKQIEAAKQLAYNEGELARLRGRLSGQAITGLPAPSLGDPPKALPAPDLSIPTDLQDALKRLESTDLAKLTRINDEVARLEDLLAKGSQDPRLAEALAAARDEQFKLANQSLNFDGDLKELSRRSSHAQFSERAARSVQEMAQALASTPTAQIAALQALLDTLQSDTTSDPLQKAEAIESITQAIDGIKASAGDLGASLRQSLGSDLRKALKGDWQGILQDWENLILGSFADSLAAEFKKRFLKQGAGATGPWGDLFSLLFSAKGNAFDANGVMPFANGGVVTAATLFGYGNGRMGVAGEAGPEAILPLQRGRNGKLGVAGGGTVIDASIKELHVGDGVSVAQARAMVNQAQAAQEARLMRLHREGRF